MWEKIYVFLDAPQPPPYPSIRLDPPRVDFHSLTSKGIFLPLLPIYHGPSTAHDLLPYTADNMDCDVTCGKEPTNVPNSILLYEDSMISWFHLACLPRVERWTSTFGQKKGQILHFEMHPKFGHRRRHRTPLNPQISVIRIEWSTPCLISYLVQLFGVQGRLPVL